MIFYHLCRARDVPHYLFDQWADVRMMMAAYAEVAPKDAHPDHVVLVLDLDADMVGKYGDTILNCIN